MKRAGKDGLEVMSVTSWSTKHRESYCIRHLDKFAQDISPEHILRITPKLKRIVCSQPFGQIGHVFCFVALRELSRTERNRGVGEEMIKV